MSASLALARAWLAAGETLLAASAALDLLDAEPHHQEALVVYLEAVGAERRSLVLTPEAADVLLQRVADPRARARLEGVLAVRRAFAMLDERVPGFVVRGWLERALAAFRRAGTDDPEIGARARAVERLLLHNEGLAERG